VRAVGIPWRPSGGRYLVMICNSGQVTNHLVCLRKHMYFGALLKRMLVLPPGSLDYKYAHLLDIAHLQQCLGSSSNSSAVMTFEDFEAVRAKNLHIGKLICYMPDCYFDRDHQSKWEALGFTFGARQDAWSSREPRRHSREEIVARFGAGEEQVVAVGDLFYAEVDEFEIAPSGSGCRSVAIRPHRSIVVAAQRFVQTYLGASFVAVHFRRHGFLVFCNKQAPGPSCFYPIPQAARCIESKVREAAADVVFLSTDAAESEAAGLVAALAQRGVGVVRRSAAHEALAKWDAVLWRQAGREAEAGVMAMVDKAICAMAVAFVGTRSSSFSAHIQSMRRDMLTASTCDAPLCHNLGPPSFQAPAD
jgi:peptide-O-fucosyltransferase